ncbi:MAG: 4Fe-4S binding protein [Candidatus Marinimicrobia bacterium]|jgi:NADH-quinone oxidoreductase subunit I|nr:4Fe-4S binding protein [Candidatus Neomarinimicrobiota bacterium]MBT3682660.1 4Fe-4S binding protein [Candidatus Neomarinimicrobiota bacterium]MBT3759685.1 4Fe-4S binding protein [Candidatus Neomarinimicrobiota bacterium]MBT3894444.1 4Fe-4S binding protein [Candidatus Neomarinimicrobiota bacterium]MBT4172486.1 4Fe-4S binding protein [Candidatus Neomarinimicrobiota bacterium]
MSEYFSNIVSGLKSFTKGLQLTMQHFNNRKKLVATLQYPHEKWPIPERNIGFELEEYNVIRSRLEVDIEDCIGCLKCERACPVDCIKIETIKPPKGGDFDCGVTTNGTQKKMLVPRFSIDMTECMFCNLCVFPCPEECIYMVGGPNSSKHEIEYEFAARERSPLIFEFAVATEKEIIAAGGIDYLNKKKGIVPDEKPKEVKSTLKKTEPKLNFEAVNAFTDRMTRALAKKAFTAGARAGSDAATVATQVKSALVDADKFLPEYESIIENIASSPLMTSAGPTTELKAKPASGPDIKLLNSITDKMVRGTAKKAFMAAKRAGKDGAGISDDIKKALTDAGKLTDEVIAILKSFSVPGNSEVSNESSVASAPDIKKLNSIEDKMVRGLAKKSFMAAKRAKSSAADTVAHILKDLKEADKLTADLEDIVKSIVPDTVDATPAPKTEFNLDIKKLNSIEDKMVRGLAKKSFMAAKRAKNSAADTVTNILNDLKEADKLTPDLEIIVKSIAPDTVAATQAPKTEFNLDIKKLNLIEDKMIRGMAKKAFMAAKRAASTPEETVAQIEAVLKENDKLIDEVQTTVKSLLENES